jgi:hypothetical protein
LISFEHNVAEMWTIDASECLTIAQSRGFIRNPLSGPESEFRDLPAPQAPDGLLIVMRLKEFQDCECDATTGIDASSISEDESEADDDDADDDDDINVGRRGVGSGRARNTTSDSKMDHVRKSMMFNPLKRSLSPFCSPSSSRSTTDILEPVCIGIFAPRGSKISAALRSPLMTWRSALRSKGLPEHRGGRSKVDVSEGETGSVPSSVLKAFVAAIDSYSIADCSSHGSGFGVGPESAGTGLEDMIWDESTGSTSGTVCAAGRELSGLPGTGFLAMRYFRACSIYFDVDRADCTVFALSTLSPYSPALTNIPLYRSAHVLSESIRLQFSTAGLQNSLSLCSATAKQAEHQPLNATPSRKLLIVTGPSGSGVRTVGGLVKKQLSAHVDMQRCHVDSAEVCIPEISSTCAADLVLKAVEDMARDTLIQPRRNGYNTAVTIVVVTIAPECHIDQGNLIKLLTSIAQTCSPGVRVSLAAVVAVVAPRALLRETAASPDMYVSAL